MTGIKQIKKFKVNGIEIGTLSNKNLMRVVYSLGIEKNLLMIENEKLKKELEDLKKPEVKELDEK